MVRKQIQYVNEINIADVKAGEIIQLKNGKCYLKILNKIKTLYIPIESSRAITEEKLDSEIIGTYSSKDATAVKIVLRG